MITPNDIETKLFSYSVRGYNKREVDEFLDQIMIDYQALLDQNSKMLERVHVLQKQVTDAKDPAKMTRDAKRLMNDISASAEQKAEVIIKNARLDAENIVRNAKNSTSQADEDAERLRRKVEKFRLRYKQMLEDEISRLDDSSEDLLDDLRKDFFPGFLYGEGNADYTKVAGSEEVDDMIADLPDVEPDEEAYEEAEEKAEEAEEAREEGQGESDEEVEIRTYSEEAEKPEDDIPEEQPEEPSEGPELEEAEAEPEEAQEEIHEEVSEEAAEPGEEAAEPEEETAEPEEEAAEAAEPEEPEAVTDPLLERAKEANVDVDDLPGFRSSISSMEDTVVIKKMGKEETVDLTGEMKADAEGSSGDLQETAGEKAKELKGAAAKLVNDLFSKKEK